MVEGRAERCQDRRGALPWQGGARADGARGHAPAAPARARVWRGHRLQRGAGRPEGDEAAARREHCARHGRFRVARPPPHRHLPDGPGQGAGAPGLPTRLSLARDRGGRGQGCDGRCGRRRLEHGLPQEVLAAGRYGRRAAQGLGPRRGDHLGAAARAARAHRRLVQGAIARGHGSHALARAQVGGGGRALGGCAPSAGGHGQQNARRLDAAARDHGRRRRADRGERLRLPARAHRTAAAGGGRL
mmetsp:Transcript_11954/g.30122  ORF Transcript_11954/g.30122 Transcript_11954/m.30122 type:complete len:245 (+) Transcript_11954:151-885(+)